MVAGIIDPTRSAQRPTQSRTENAPQLGELRGARIALFENTKRNAAEILDAVGAALADGHGAGELVRRRKPQFAMPLTQEQIDDLVASSDAVVIGVGDCGSCSAAAVADGIVLERAGLPVAVVCTEAFEDTSRAMAQLQGDAEYPFLTTPHPVANLDEAGVRERGEQLAAGVAERLTGTRATVGAGA